MGKCELCLPDTFGSDCMRHSKLAAHAVSNPFRPSSLAWVAIPLGAFGFLIWTNVLRVQRVENVSKIGERSGTAPAIDAAAPAGRSSWQPRLIVPEHDNTSYEWLDQTRQMFARREWRVRHIDYENAPFGREVSAASPYRWWLGTLAWLDHAVSGRPAGWSVERAALIADPLLHLLLLGAATVFVAWQFGAFPAALLSMGLAAVFPFAAGFLPGAPNDQGLVLACAFWSVLPLLAGIREAHAMAADAAAWPSFWFEELYTVNEIAYVPLFVNVWVALVSLVLVTSAVPSPKFHTYVAVFWTGLTVAV